MTLSKTKNTEGQVLTTQHGFRLATSTEGALTGRGGDIIIIDDPLKADDAYSESKRTSVNHWFMNTLQSRLDNKREGAIVIIMQRLHPDDLVGFLLDKSDDWKVLRLPAIAETDGLFHTGDYTDHRRRAGDVLNPGLEPLPILNRLKRDLGSDVFEAQYQQNPVPPGGTMIKREWIQSYTDRPKTKFIFQSWDTAAKEGGQNDWSVCTTWAVIDNHFFLLDVFRKRLSYPDLRHAAKDLWRRWRANKVFVEDVGIGSGLVADLKRAGVSAIAVVPKGDKISRVALQSAKFESGFVHFPKDAPWLGDLMTELLSFPNGRHDDQVDSITQALANIKRLRDHAGVVEAFGGILGGPTWIEMQYGPYGSGRRRFY